MVIFISVVGVLIEGSPLILKYIGINIQIFLIYIIAYSLIFPSYYSSLFLGVMWGGITSLFSSCNLAYINLFAYPIVGIKIVWITKRLRDEVLIFVGIPLVILACLFVNFLHFAFCYQFSSLLFFSVILFKQTIISVILIELILTFKILYSKIGVSV